MKEDRFSCPDCRKSFIRKDMLLRHQMTHEKQQFECDLCSKTFSRKDNLLSHRRIHERPTFTCTECEKTFTTRYNIDKHRRTRHGRVAVPRQLMPTQARSERRVLNTFSFTFFYPQDEAAFDVMIFKETIKIAV